MKIAMTIGPWWAAEHRCSPFGDFCDRCGASGKEIDAGELRCYRGASIGTLARRQRYGVRKGRRASLRLRARRWS